MAFDAPIEKQPKIRRREFLTWSAGGAFMLSVAGAAKSQQARPAGAPPGGQSPWFEISKEGRLLVNSSAVEMGQGSHTGHATLIAHELDVPWDQVDVRMVDIQEYANQIFTGGSSSIGGGRPGTQPYEVARTAGATARNQFMQAAAKQWNVPVEQVETAGGKVVNKTTKQALTYGELAVAAAKITPQNVAYLDRPINQCIGKDMPTKRLEQRVTGQEVYGIDTRVPGMKFAAVRQAPKYGAKVATLDEAAALAIPGVSKVVKYEQGGSGGVAVIAKDSWTAFKGADALKITWAEGSTATNEGFRKGLVDQISAKLKEAPADAAKPLRATYDSAAKKVEQSYDLEHVSHVTMEPQNATVHVTGNKVEVWAPTQVPSSVKRGAAGWAGKPATAEVVLHTTMLGGGFGRRLATDFVEQAVKIASQVDYPVHMIWTREEDFTHDTYRRGVRQLYRAGLREDGLIDGYEVVPCATDSNVSGGMGASPYNAIKAAVVTQAGNLKTGIPQGPWRSVDEGISTWGRESFIDECAIAAGQDSFEYRMKLLGDNARAKKLLQAVADKIDWKKKRPAGTGVGIAIGTGFGSMAAHAVEVQVSKDNQVKVTRIVAAGDLGTVIAPSQVRGQFEGGTLMALGTALSESQTFKDGAAEKSNFDTYRVLRTSQAPKIEVILLESPGERVGGAGEPCVPTLAPALTAAIHKATGKRVRSLPIDKQGFKV